MVQSKIFHFASVAAAVVILFTLVGSVFKPSDSLALVFLLTVLMWSALRIVFEGVLSAIALVKGDKGPNQGE